MMRHPRQRNPLADISVEMDDLFRTIRVLKQAFELRLQPFVALIVGRFVTQLDLAVSRKRDTIVWIGQIL